MTRVDTLHLMLRRYNPEIQKLIYRAKEKVPGVCASWQDQCQNLRRPAFPSFGHYAPMTCCRQGCAYEWQSARLFARCPLQTRMCGRARAAARRAIS